MSKMRSKLDTTDIQFILVFVLHVLSDNIVF